MRLKRKKGEVCAAIEKKTRESYLGGTEMQVVRVSY